MLLSLSDGNFNIPNSQYRSQFLYHYCYFGNFRYRSLIGPNGSNSGGFSRHNSLIKGYSESLERIALMETMISKKKSFPAINVRTLQTDIMSDYEMGYCISNTNFSDTTGTAGSLDSAQLINKSIFELIEKNALFVMWYGNKGVHLSLDKTNSNIQRLLRTVKAKSLVPQYFAYSFGLIHTVLCLLERSNGVFFSSGVSGNTNLERAIFDSTQEALVLGWSDHTRSTIKEDFFPKGFYEENDKIYHLFKHTNAKNQIVKMSSLENKDDVKIKDLLSSLPTWISDIRISVLPHASFSDRPVTIMAYSRNLFNGLPNKDSINLARSINQKTIHLTYSQL